MTNFAKPDGINEFIAEYLRDGASIEANVNGSVTPVEFAWTASRRAFIYDLICSVEDASTFAAGGYGGGAAMTTGLAFEHRQSGGATRDLFDTAGLKTNADWAELTATNFSLINFGGGGNNAFAARWVFDRSGIPLYMNTGDVLAMVVNDDLSGLARHRFLIHGRYVGVS